MENKHNGGAGLGDGDIFAAVGNLHGWSTGSFEAYGYDPVSDRNFLEKRLKNWRQPECEFDTIVKILIACTIRDAADRFAKEKW